MSHDSADSHAADWAPARPDAPASSSATVGALQTRVRALEEQLVACQRLATLGNLASMAAHEFRNLMTPIVARAEASLSIDDPAFVRKTVERALIQSQRATRVCDHLLSYAHDKPHTVERTSVAAALAEAIETATRPFEKDGIDLRVDVPADLHVAAQPDLYCQVLVNMLLNARQAMHGVRGLLRVSAAAAGPEVAVIVRDSGKGFAPGHIDRVLNPFLAASPLDRPSDWHAVGLGLSVCRMIAWKHGATLRASANDGVGVTFTLNWPAFRG